MKKEHDTLKLLSLSLLPFSVVLWVIASWITHIIVCFKAASWGFLIAGAIFFPVAVAHGTWLWFQ